MNSVGGAEDSATISQEKTVFRFHAKLGKETVPGMMNACIGPELCTKIANFNAIASDDFMKPIAIRDHFSANAVHFILVPGLPIFGRDAPF